MYSEILAQPIFAKASSKVLLVGGYGVLQQHNLALILTLQTYFYSITTFSHNSAKKTSISNNQGLKDLVQIVVKSPQIHGQWQYTFDRQANIIVEKYDKNTFVQNALKYSLQYFVKEQESAQMPASIQIHIFFDQGFLSDKSFKQPQPQKQSQQFICYEDNSTKTGLGSSACVLVSIVRAIASIFHCKDQKIINSISQVANLGAQHKIGSNFDISAAIYGSHLYCNVLPRLAYSVLQDHQTIHSLLSVDIKVQPLNSNNLHSTLLHSALGLIVDINKGANTRTMVASFLQNLSLLPQSHQQLFYHQSQIIAHQVYQAMTNQTLHFKELRNNLQNLNQRHRHLQQSYSHIGIIEPGEFKAVLDEINAMDCVLYGICPGSGGYDALFVLISIQHESEESAMSKIRNSLLSNNIEGLVKKVEIKWDSDMEVTAPERERLLRAQTYYFG